MLVATDVTRAHVDAEISQLDPWAKLHGWGVTWDSESLLLTVGMRSKVDEECYVIEMKLDDYRALPPLIELVHPTLNERGTRRCFPGGGRGYFHSNPVVCAPWNRKAYAAHGGPHADWAMASWATYRPNHSQIGDMLVLLQELIDDRSSYSGRMAQ